MAVWLYENVNTRIEGIITGRTTTCQVPLDVRNTYIPGFRIRIFFADPDPGKNFHADPDADPGGIRGRGLGIKGKNDFF